MPDVDSSIQTYGIISTIIGLAIVTILSRFKPPGLDKVWKIIEEIRRDIFGKDGITERLTRSETTQGIYIKYFDQLKDNLARDLHSDEDEFGCDVYLERIKDLTPEEKCYLRDKAKEAISKLDKKDSRRFMFIQLLTIIEMEIPNWK